MLRSCDASLVVFQHYRLMLTRKKLLTHVQALLLSTQKMYKVQDILCEVYYSYVLSGLLKPWGAPFTLNGTSLLPP
jgi:hypothetical protein